MRRTRLTSKTHFSLELHRKNRVRFYFCHVSARQWAQLYAFSPATSSTRNNPASHVARRPGLLLPHTFSTGQPGVRSSKQIPKRQDRNSQILALHTCTRLDLNIVARQKSSAFLFALPNAQYSG